MRYKKRHLENGVAQAVIVNSGNANTCNANGYDIANHMCLIAAETLGVKAEDVIVASTGVIGQPLPIQPILKACVYMKGHLTKEGGTDAAEAIMTTDTVKKEWLCRWSLTARPLQSAVLQRAAV